MDDALDPFLSVPTADSNSYEAVKSAILVRAGIATHSQFQKFLQFNPRFNETAAQYFGTATDILRKLAEGLTMDQFIQTLALEFTLHTAYPQIISFVRALQRQKPRDYIHELDQYMVTRGFEHDKLWKRPSNRLRPQWQQRPQSSQSSATTTSPAIKPEQPVPREKTHTTDKQPHRLAKYFDMEKGLLCFACKKWGYLATIAQRNKYLR